MLSFLNSDDWLINQPVCLIWRQLFSRLHYGLEKNLMLKRFDKSVNAN